MTTSRRSWNLPVGHRVEGEPWQIRFVELKGAAAGPTTAFIAGIYGDKALGCLTIHALEKRLAAEEIKGRVILIPAANPPALANGTRINPDHLYLNRRFPGQASGFLTDQLAHHLFRQILELSDCIVDLQPGTPVTAMRYIYDYGDLAFTAAFGYLPVIAGRPIEGQLSVAAAAAGARSSLAEYSGGPVADLSTGVEGALNLLRYRGQLGGKMSGPRRLPLIRRLRFFHPSTAGILQGRHGPAQVGETIGKGLIGWVVDAAKGERVEEFHLEEEGILLLATTTPAVVAPGQFGFMVGHPEGEVEVPQV